MLGYEKEDEEDDHQKGEERCDDKQAFVFPSGTKEETSSKEKILSERMRNEAILVNYDNKRPKLQLTPVSPYLQASMILKDHRPSVCLLQQM